jgi:DNA repair photolyase
MEPGAPNPFARLEAMQYLVENGVSAGVMMAPLLPGISDDEANIQEVVSAAHSYKAEYLGANVLFLKPGSKEWFMPMLKEAYPHLDSGYNRLYGNRTYAPEQYTKIVLDTVDRVRRQWSLPDRAKIQEKMEPRGQLQFAFAA